MKLCVLLYGNHCRENDETYKMMVEEHYPNEKSYASFAFVKIKLPVSIGIIIKE